MSTDKQNNEQTQNRWLRMGLFTLTVLGPIINTIVERLRRRSQELQENAQTAQSTARERFGNLTHTGRQLALEQAQQLQEQARQLQVQAAQLRKALGENAEQSLKVAGQMREVAEDWRRGMLKRGEQLTDELSERGEELVKRGRKATRDLAKRSSKMAQDLAERGSELVPQTSSLLEPVRKRNATFWTVLGFSVGLAAAIAATYLFVRQRLIQQEAEQDQQIELPQNGYRATAETPSQPKTAATE